MIGRTVARRQPDARQVQTPGAVAAIFRQKEGGGDDERQHDGDIDEEDGAPVEILEQDAADQWPDQAAKGEGCTPNTNRPITFLLIREEVDHQRQR